MCKRRRTQVIANCGREPGAPGDVEKAPPSGGVSASWIDVSRGLPEALRERYFAAEGPEWIIGEEPRRMVRFLPLDLRSDFTGLGHFDLVLCRNVLIYFETASRRDILARIHRQIHPGSYLLLGASETTFQLHDGFRRIAAGKMVIYQAE